MMTTHPHLILAALLVLVNSCLHAEDVWWNKDWTHRQKITMDAAGIGGSTGETTLLLRISDGTLFGSARDDGGDLRCIAVDGNTELPHDIEHYDSLLGEAYVWVKIPEIKPGKSGFYLYFGNPSAETPSHVPSAYAAKFSAVHHFSEIGSPPADSTPNGNNASAPAMTAEGAIIGSGMRLSHSNVVVINPTNRLNWTAENPVSLSCWIKPSHPQPNQIILSRGEAGSAFRLLLDQGVPVVEIVNGGNTVRSPLGPPITAGAWHHIAWVADAGKVKLFSDGVLYSNLAASLSALSGPVTIGALLNGINADVDELCIYDSALTDAEVRLSFINQGGSEITQPILTSGSIEVCDAGDHRILEHLLLFRDIASNMMFDGWMAIAVCTIMIVVSWTVAIRKCAYLNRIKNGNLSFLLTWKKISRNLTSADSEHQTWGSILEVSQSGTQLKGLENSPIYELYQIGSEEISHRLEASAGRASDLSTRSMQAIRASLDTGLLQESHRLTDGLVFLTISVAGGPYVGLLGTVVGVMITFAIIAKSGEVNVNSIAPGIASALLATVMGLVVAIPALFIYSYLNNRIKNEVNIMQRFIDEFIAKVAEFYSPKPDSAVGRTHPN